MIDIYRTQDRSFIVKFLLKEEVWKFSSSFREWAEDEFIMNPECLYLVAADQGEVIGLFTIEQMTKQTAEVHMHIARKYWGKGKSDIAMDCIKKTLHSTLKYDRILTSAPELCVEVLRALKRNGGRLIGKVEKGTALRGEVCDLCLFQFDIEGMKV